MVVTITYTGAVWRGPGGQTTNHNKLRDGRALTRPLLLHDASASHPLVSSARLNKDLSDTYTRGGTLDGDHGDLEHGNRKR